MADTKISALSSASVAAVANELAINEAGTSKKISITQLVTLLQTLGMPRVKRLNSQHSNSSTTATIMSDLSLTLEAGTYFVDYRIFCRTSSATVSPMFAVNFTGTAAVKNFWFEYADASATLLAAIGTIDDVGVTTVGFGMRMAQSAYATTAANMGNTSSANAMATTTTDHQVRISGLMIVTASGSLDIYHGSESASATTAEVGSSLAVIRTA